MPIPLPAPLAPCDCLGCRNCAGLCWSLLELHRIPDFVLRTRKP